MNETDWLRSTDPVAMLEWWRSESGPERSRLFGAPALLSDRKLRLFACACCRLAQPMQYQEAQEVVWAAEEVAEEGVLSGEATTRMRVARKSIDAIAGWFWCATSIDIATTLRTTIDEEVTQRPGYGNSAGLYSTQIANLLRDIAGNPWRPVTLRAEWHTAMVGIIAQAAYDSGKAGDGTLDQPTLAVLADALGEAGCTNEEILRHLRGQERCPKCLWVEQQGYDRIPASIRCECEGAGWIKLRGLHVRGCWAVDLILGKN